MANRLCDVCGVRPATVAIRRIVPGGGQRVEHLCDLHAAQARGGRSSFGGGGLFDDFFNRFFETPGGPRRIPIGEEATGRRAEQVDVTQFFSDSTNELLQRAAQRAMEWGSADLTARPLRRTIQRRIDNELSRMILNGALEPQDKVIVGAEDGELTFEVVEGAAVTGGAG